MSCSRESKSLPWEEKYRPHSLDQIIGQGNTIQVIKSLINSGNTPHLLFHGPPGTGKTSTIHAIARELYGVENKAQMVMEINSGDARGLETIQSQLKTFASTRPIFKTRCSELTAKTKSQFKLVILDEADTMDYAAQMALRRIMEDYACNVRFCIIVNHMERLSRAIVSRCINLRFRPLPPSAIKRQLLSVVKEEGIAVEPEAVEGLVQLSKGDMCQALSMLQKCGLGGDDRLLCDSKPLTSACNITHTISVNDVYDLASAPRPSDINRIMRRLLSPGEFSKKFTYLKSFASENSIDLADIVSALAEALRKLNVGANVKVVWLEGLAEIEWFLRGGASEQIQMGGVISVIERGRLLIDCGDFNFCSS